MSGRDKPAGVSAIELGRDFFREVVKPTIERICPDVLDQAACGRMGLGSECLGLDDTISRDHHWGPRVDLLLSEFVCDNQDDCMFCNPGQYCVINRITDELPEAYRGFPLEAGHVGGKGLSPESLKDFLQRSIGRQSAPETLQDWLDIPEEDIIHVVNGEVWHDGPGTFTKLRAVFNAYYPDAVWKRRIAHWCRYCSGMGLYPIRRALLRKNVVYAHFALGRTLKLTMELTFLLNRTYFSYDKWLYPLFKRLPELAPDMVPMIDETMKDDCGWERRIELLERMHEMLDQRMVDLGIIPAHPKFVPSKTSGYRLLEHAYCEIIKQMPEEIRTHVPLWDQKFFEEFHSGFVFSLEINDWDAMLGLKTTP